MSTVTSQIEQLRAVADLLEAHPELPSAYIAHYGHSNRIDVNWYLHLNGRGLDLVGQKSTAAEIARTIGGTWDKTPRDEEFEFTQTRDDIAFTILVKRDAVCERIVVGTETVEVPASPARRATEARTVERDVVEWRCEPLFAETQATRVPGESWGAPVELVVAP